MEISSSTTKQSLLKVGDIILSRPGTTENVILLASISSSGVVGIGINCAFEALDLQLICDQQDIWFPTNAPVYQGGRINMNRLYIIHSNDWAGSYTVKLNRHLSLTTDTSVLRSLADGSGPKKFRACAGFYTWPSDSLQKNLDSSWSVVPGTTKLVFGSGSGTSQWRAGLAGYARTAATDWLANRLTD